MRTKAILHLLLIMVSLFTMASEASAATPSKTSNDINPSNIILRGITGSLSLPVFITNAGDGSGRLFIVEKAGRIRIIKNGALLSTPFLDIHTIVNSSGNEQGLLALAFHPNYTSNGQFYTVHTDQNGSLVLSRFTRSSTNPDLADPSSRITLLTINHPTNQNHNGGTLAFGPDTYLYWSTGDGGGAGDPPNNAQNLGSLLGKILRLDVDSGSPYSIPSSNPFYNDPNPATRKEIWAYGLRNPWRLSFDRQTGDIFIGDVGQSAREEIDFQPAASTGGENYGWHVMEGSICYNPPSGCDQSGKVLPIAEYDHSVGCAVTGGYVYRGSDYAPMQGYYFYGDFCTGVIFALRNDPVNGWIVIPIADTPYNISTFGEDESGEIYLADYSAGNVYQFCYASNADVRIAGGNQAAIPLCKHQVAAQGVANMNIGPVQVVSADGTTPILASERFIRTYQSSTSYSELMGYPGSQLTTEYWFPWYNNIATDAQLRVSNLGVQQTTASVYIGNGQLLDTIPLNAGEAVRRNYPGVTNGPLHVVSSGNVPILSSLRVLYGSGYSELMGYPGNQLTSEYWFPWYNNVATDAQLRVSNAGAQSTTVSVYVGNGQLLDTIPLNVGETIRKNYPGVTNGPLHVVSSGNVPILSSLRILYSSSYAELMGYPGNQLTTEYWFPWYNNVTMDAQLRASNLGAQPTTVSVYIGNGQLLDTISLNAGEAVRRNYPGVTNGPLHVVSSGNVPILSSLRILYNSSYAELMGYPGNQLTTEYWFPWYNNVGLDSKLRVGRP